MKDEIIKKVPLRQRDPKEMSERLFEEGKKREMGFRSQKFMRPSPNKVNFCDRCNFLTQP